MPRITTRRAAIAAVLLYAAGLLVTFGPPLAQHVVVARIFGGW